MYSTKEAAQYLGITVAGIWYHIQRGNIKQTKIGNSLAFSKEQLDCFIKSRRPAGRPVNKKEQ